MDTTTHMRSIIAVARHGSFSAAARELSVSPAVVSKHVSQLEDRLGTRLMNRTTRGVSLTDPGRLYCDRALDILALIEDAENAVTSLSNGTQGSLRISCPPAFGTRVLTPMLGEFIRENPNLKVDLSLQDDEPDVVAQRLDLVIRLGKLEDSSLIARKIADAEFVLCASPTFAARERPHTLGDLHASNCLIDTSVHADNTWRFRHEGRVIEIQVDGNFRSLSTEAVIQAALDGLGLAYVPYYAVKHDLEARRLECIEGDFETTSTTIYAMYLGRKHASGKTRAFIDALTAYLPDVVGH